MIRTLAIVALLSLAQALAQTDTHVTCHMQVMCDDPMPPNALGDGLDHKYGDIAPQCLDPNFKGPVDIFRGGVCDLPETPQPQPKPVRKVHFLTMAKPSASKALRTNKQVFTDPTFLIPVGGCIASMVTDVEVTNGARKQFRSQAPVVGVIAGLSYLSHRYLFAPFSLGMGTYCIQQYTRDAMQ